MQGSLLFVVYINGLDMNIEGMINKKQPTQKLVYVFDCEEDSFMLQMKW